MAVGTRAGTGRGWALLLVGAYTVAAVAPVAAAARLGARGESLLLTAGLMAALAGFTLLCLQVLLAARVYRFERPFGLDMVLRFHRNMGILALLLLAAHPVLVAWAGGGAGLLFGAAVPWPVWFGRLAFLALVATVLLSLLQPRIGLTFESWRSMHDVLGPFILVIGLAHLLAIGEDLRMPLLKGFFITAFALAAVLFAHHRIVRPMAMKRMPYSVTDVKSEAPGVWSVKVSPPRGKEVFGYLPGQFQFITFYRGRGLPVEEHHWTISTSPTEDGVVGSTIKALGDFTSTMGETRVGDKAAVHGAFGRFSHLLHPGETDLVFVAGGIGITPVMGMLRYMRDVSDTRDVQLLYGNRSEEEIVFREELARMEAGGNPRLRVVHVLSSPGQAWAGEKGFVTGDVIRRHCTGDLNGKAFYLCGPRGMLDSLTSSLRAMGVHGKRICVELFSFLD